MQKARDELEMKKQKDKSAVDECMSQECCDQNAPVIKCQVSEKYFDIIGGPTLAPIRTCILLIFFIPSCYPSPTGNFIPIWNTTIFQLKDYLDGFVVLKMTYFGIQIQYQGPFK